jgi:hypothetical protein
MTILEVADNKKLQQEFLLLPVKIYAEDANWIRPLSKMENINQNYLNQCSTYFYLSP